MSLKEKAFASVRWTMVSSFGRALLQFFQLTLLAHFVGSKNFGLIAILGSVVGVVQVISDGGLSSAIIQSDKCSAEQKASLYWLNVFVSSILAAVLISLSYWIALVYEKPELVPLLWIASCGLIVSGFGQQVRALAQKDLKFESLAKVDIVSALVGFVVTVSFAVGGEGAYGYIVGAFVTALTTTILLLTVVSESRIPRFRLKLGEIRHFLRFGLYVVGNNLVNALNLQVDVLLGAKLVGSASIGIYSVPRDLSLKIIGVINPIVTSVGFPLMVKARQSQLALGDIYLKIIRMTASVNAPINVFGFFYAEELIFLLLGAGWAESVPFLRVFCCWALVRSFGNPAGSLLLAVGKADLSFKWNVGATIGLVPFIYVGSLFGVFGLAIGSVVYSAVTFVPFWFWVIKPCCNVKFKDYVWQMVVPFSVALVSVGLSYLGVEAFLTLPARLLLGVLGSIVLYATLSYWMNRVWFDSIVALVSRRL